MCEAAITAVEQAAKVQTAVRAAWQRGNVVEDE